MAPTKKRKPTILVVCNPYAAIDVTDGDSRCSGAFPFEPSRRNDDVEVRHVGARRVVTELASAVVSERRVAEHDIAHEFHHEPVKLPQSQYYWRAMREGPAGSRALLPADAKTHAWVFGSAAGFKDPHAIIAQKAMEHGFMPAAFGELSEDDAKRDAAVTWETVLAPHTEKLKADRAAAEKLFIDTRAERDAAAVKASHEHEPIDTHAEVHDRQ